MAKDADTARRAGAGAGGYVVVTVEAAALLVARLAAPVVLRNDTGRPPFSAPPNIARIASPSLGA